MPRNTPLTDDAKDSFLRIAADIAKAAASGTQGLSALVDIIDKTYKKLLELASL